MNRRNAIKAAITGVAAACGLKAKPKITMRGFWARITSVGYSPISNKWGEKWERKCWECDGLTPDVVCHRCGFDSGVQPDGSFLVPPRFTAELNAMCNANRT